MISKNFGHQTCIRWKFCIYYDSIIYKGIKHMYTILCPLIQNNIIREILTQKKGTHKFDIKCLEFILSTDHE